MAQTLGIIDAIYVGTKIPLEKGAKFNPGGYKQNPVVAGRQVFYCNEVVASQLTGTTVLQAGQKLADLIPTGAGELQVICDTGQVYVVPDAFRTEVPDVTGGEGGKIELKFQGSPATEIS